MCFRPNSRASIDHAPGPIIAEVAPKVARMTGIHGAFKWVAATPTSITAINVPTTGVHRPMRRSTPTHAPATCGTMDEEADVPVRSTIPKRTSKIAARTRWSRSPTPGQPLANVENSRCKKFVPHRMLGKSQCVRKVQKREARILLLGEIQFDDAALQTNRHGMSPVIGAKLGENVRNMALYGCLTDRKPISDLFI